MAALALRMACVCRLDTSVKHALDFLLGAKHIWVKCNEDLAAASTAALAGLIHIGSAAAVCQQGCCQVKGNGHAASFPVSGGEDALAFLNGARVAGQVAVLVKSARERKFLAGQTVNAQLAVCILAHGHVKHNGSVLSWDGNAERVVANARLIASPKRHAALSVNPADSHESGFCHTPCIGAAPHPMGRVLKGHAADAVFLGQFHGTVRTEQGVGNPDSKVAVVILHRAPGSHQLRLAIQVNPAFLHIFHKTRDTVKSVALNTVRAGLGVDGCTDLCLLFA